MQGLKFFPYFNCIIKIKTFIKGLEKLNDLTTGHYFNSTNKQQNFLLQLMNKRNRLEYLSLAESSFDIYEFLN
jgi:tRNA U34 2-thiouridine synthase MnmA/TrmU